MEVPVLLLFHLWNMIGLQNLNLLPPQRGALFLLLLLCSWILVLQKPQCGARCYMFNCTEGSGREGRWLSNHPVPRWHYRHRTATPHVREAALLLVAHPLAPRLDKQHSRKGLVGTRSLRTKKFNGLHSICLYLIE